MKLKYAKSKLGRIEFKYSENMSTRGDGKLWNQDLVEAYLNGKKVGYLKIDYVKDKTFWKVLPNKTKFAEYFGQFGESFTDEEKLRKEYKDFYYHWVDCPMVDFIKVDDQYQRSGVGYVMYIAGAMWMAEKGMSLHASSLQSPEAKAAWDKLKRIGLPIKTYKNQAGETRISLDYRNRERDGGLIKEIEGNDPNTYYHVTFEKHLKKIKRYGLKAREKGEWTGMMGQDIREKKGIFVFDNYYDALMWAFKSSWDKKNEKIWILKIKPIVEDFELDTHWEANSGLGKWLVKQSAISPEEIVEYIPFDIAKWTPELTIKINDLRKKRMGLL